MDSKLGKEILILVLLLIVIMFVLGILLYDFIPGKKENIKSVEYVADESVNTVLTEIKENTGIDIQEKNSDVPLKSYSIDASDLDVYASENYYESGKSDPFAENSNPAEEIFRTTSTSGNATGAQSPNSVIDKNDNTVSNENNKAAMNVSNQVQENIVIESKSETTAQNTATNTSNTTQGVFFEKPNDK